MARTTMTLLVALTVGWCASTVGVAHAHDEPGARALTRAAAAMGPPTISHAGLRQPAARVGRTRAACQYANQWLGLPYLNRYADGKCGYYISVVTLPILPTKYSPGLAAFPAQAVTLYQEDEVQIAPKAAFTLSSGSTLIMNGDPRKIDTTYLDLSVNGTLVVQPGAAFRVAGGSIRVAGAGASLQMRGTQAQPIVLTSDRPTPAPGDWGRIEFNTGTTGMLSYVHLSYAGATRHLTGNGSYTAHAGIVINGAAVTVTHSIIDHSAGNGIEIGFDLSGVVSEPVLDTDQLLDNAGWAVRYDFVPRDLMKLTNLRARGRGLNVIGITPGVYGTTSGAWHSPGLPLRIASDAPQSGGDLVLGTAKETLTIAAGTTIQLESGNNIVVRSGGLGLRMQGTARQPIILTSDRPTPAPGDWGRVEFDTGTGTLSYVHLSYAGATRNFSGTGSYAAHAGVLINGAAVTITHSIIDHSSGHDVEIAGLSGLSEPILHHDQFLAVRPGNFGVINDAGATGAPINATNNYWGTPNGPRDPAHNPAGTGTRVSARVTYRPWLTR